MSLKSQRIGLAMSVCAVGAIGLIADAFARATQAERGRPKVTRDAEPDHPNVAIIKRYYEAYGKGDLDTVRTLLAKDIRWHIPGHHPLAGTKNGQDEVFAFFKALGKAKFKADVYFLEANDTYVIDHHRGYGEFGGDKLDLTWCLVFKIVDGKIAEATNFCSDQHAADAFFWKVYPLKPLPDRLAK